MGYINFYKDNDRPLHELALGIVMEAVKDYRYALKAERRTLERDPGQNTKRNIYRHLLATRKLDRIEPYGEIKPRPKYYDECEKFFLGEWFQMLTEANGKAIMEELQKEIFGRTLG